MKKIALSLVVCNLFATTTFAETSSIQSQIEQLKNQVSELENKLAEQSKQPENSIESALKGIQVSGYVSSGYQHNFNSPTEDTNVARVFDRDADSFNLNAAKLVFQKNISEESAVGFRTDLLFGNDAEVIHSAGLGESTDAFDLEQAFVEMKIGSSKAFSGMNDFNLKAGKFVTLAGAEVIESKDNWNTSRGLLFGYAIPFTHTGVRATYVFDNGWDLILGVNNGWDSVDDTNDAKTIEAHLGINNLELPADSTLSIAFNNYYGAEAADNNGSKRNVFDLVMTYKTPWKPLTLVYNFDYGTEEDLVAPSDDAKWWGHAAYARYDINEDWSFSMRAEYFKDQDGVRIVSGTSANYREFTGTLEYRPWSNLTTRFELRNDHSSESVFNDENSATKDSQTTASGEVIFSF